MVSANQGFNEVIVVGLGIGFHAKPRDIIPLEKIEKVFELKREDYYKMLSLAQEIDEEVFNASYKIIKRNEERFKMVLENHAYLVLIDPIKFTLDRYRKDHEGRGQSSSHATPKRPPTLNE